MWFTVVLFLGVAAGCLVLARRPVRESQRLHRGGRFAAEMQLYVAPDDMARVDDTLDRRYRARLHYGAVALVVAALVTALPGGFLDAEDLILPAFYLGILVAAGVATLLGELAPRPRPGTAVRTARLRALQVSDFVHPAMRAYLGCLALIGLLLPITGRLGLPGDVDVARPAVLFPTALFLGCEALTRVILRLPQPAGTPGELYLADSLRADGIWKAYWFSAIYGLLVLFMATPASNVDGLVPLLLIIVAGGAVPGFVATRSRLSHLRFRERLWTELPADTVVSSATGAPVS